MDISSRSTSHLVNSHSIAKCNMHNSSAYERIGFMFGGVFDEYSRRLEYFTSDFVDGLNRKTVSAALFMFFATLFSTVALGEHLREHHNMIGVKEYLLMNAAAGMFFSLFSCQPLMILRPTGPITLILQNLIKIALHYNVNFWQLLAMCGYSVGMLMTLIAAFELSRYIKHLTRFTHEIFTCFVCSIYIYGGVHDVIANFSVSNSCDSGDDADCDAEPFGTSLFMLLLALCTFIVSAGLTKCYDATASNSIIPVSVQRVLSDYAVTIAVILMTLLSLWPQSHGANIKVHRVHIPDGLVPTAINGDGSARSWVASFDSDDANNKISLTALLGVLCSFPIVFFFYIDQNLSSQLSQAPHMPGMRKGIYLHSPFLVVAVCNFIGPMIGLPFVTASLPHSPQFVAALTDATTETSNWHMDESTRTQTCSSDASQSSDHEKQLSGTYNSKSPVQTTYVTYENRIAPFLVYFLIGVVAMSPVTVRMIPLGAVRGVLAFIGAIGFADTELFRRIMCLLRSSEQMRKLMHWKSAATFTETTDVQWGRISAYTLLQIAVLVIFWVINLSPVGLAVAFGVAALGPFRLYIMPIMFSSYELEILDEPQY